MKGNEAIARRRYVRCRRLFRVSHHFRRARYLNLYGGQSPDNKRDGCTPGESEVAAINMVYGGAACGKKVMTSSSRQHNLKQEGKHILREPSALSDSERGTRRSGTWYHPAAQSDYFQATKGGGHGDYHLLASHRHRYRKWLTSSNWASTLLQIQESGNDTL
jgi:hypothetical protein